MIKSDYHSLETVDSTQDFAKKNLEKFDPKALTVITSLEQTKGKGRFDRSWFSPKGLALYVTYCFQLPHLDFSVSPITLVLALSICETLQKLGVGCQIKWPNDLYLEGKKLGGILAESEMIASGYQFFLGYGLNVNIPKESLEKRQLKATSLLSQTGKNWELGILQSSIEATFKRDLHIFKEKGFEPFKSSFERISFLYGKSLSLKDGSRTLSGKYEGINKEGALVLRDELGHKHESVSGEIINWE